ncbi:MAG: right-handed parallel beta-helix repeat-containing protein [Acidobacteria bacterium]|nr:right-handed parallel beta-helix repeat-containing protein [Acidobacteriota bacterium]
MLRRVIFPALIVSIGLFVAGAAKPKSSFDVRDFGAAGNGTEKDTSAFQKALDACAVSGGGEVVVPAGKYLIGSIQMGNRTILRLEKNSILTGSPDLADYPIMDIRWEGRWQQGHRALIYAGNVDHTGIIGPGRIEGNRAVAFGKGLRGAPVLEPISCNDLRWEDFSVTHDGTWATHPTYCANVVIRNLHIRNTRDGIDVDSCKNVRIEGCDIDTGDDAISLKSGRGMNGARIGIPTENVLITRCVLGGGWFACIGIGSETSGGIRNVRIEKTRFTHSGTQAIYIKTRTGRAGVIENITGEDLDVANGGFLKINATSGGNQSTPDDTVEGDLGYPIIRSIRFSNVRLKDVTTLVDAIKIAPEKPICGLTLTDITGTCKKGIILSNIRDAVLRGIRVTGFSGPLLAIENTTGSGIRGAVPLK